jgi:putative DNA primase/helicase
MACSPTGPYPILCINAEHGGAKTTTTRVIRSLIDPNKADIRPAPKEERDLIIAASNGWILAFDNVSHIPENMADAMCRVATGTGFGTRKLYEDTEETLICVCRPQIVNGIPDLASRADFADRTVAVSLPTIPDDKRKDEKNFWAEFYAAQPRILGALLDGVSCTLRRINAVKPTHTPRMADFARWAEAAAAAFGWADGHFLKVYGLNRQEVVEATLEADLVATALRGFMFSKPSWTGTATELLGQLSHPVTDGGNRYWPRTPANLSSRLKRLAPALRTTGLHITIGDRTATARAITIRKQR